MRKRFSANEILELLNQFYKEYGHPPAKRDPEVKNLIGHARREFGSWSNALKIAGLQTYKEYKRRHSIEERLLQCLNLNPLTLGELKKQLGVKEIPILSSLLKQGRILSSGRHGKKVYYLPGQEASAEFKLEKTDPIIYLYSFLDYPRTAEEISRELGLSKSQISSNLQALTRERLVYKMRFLLGRIASPYSPPEIFGEMSYKTIYCRSDCLSELATYIIQRIPKDNDPHKRKAITSHFKRILPKEVFEHVQGHY